MAAPLETLCDPYRTHIRVIAQPWSVVIDGRPAAFATNGRSLALARLVAFAGEPGLTRACNRCEGSLEVSRECHRCGESHKCACKKCDGDGTLPAKLRLAFVGSTPLNLVYLATALAVVEPVDFCEVRASGDTLRIDARGWRIVVMGVRTSEWGTANWPRFALAAEVPA
jgi:hypothetical protein